MTKPKPRPQRPVEAAREALARETAKRPDGLKPIEIVKTALCAYQDHENASKANETPHVESADSAGLRRGTQAAVDRLLFNANYWLAAYEERIIAACDPADAPALLSAVSVWSTHTLKLNTLDNAEAVATFERFCPPFAANNRRGSSRGRSKGPIAEFEAAVRQVGEHDLKHAESLLSIASDMRAEAAAYEALPGASALDALFAILPAWCLQDKIGLVSVNWWEDADVMMLLADELRKRFIELGFGEAPCQYFHDSLLEAVDAYQQDVTSTPTPLAALPVPELLEIVHAAREARPTFDVDGYGEALPAWLAAKEQLIWNTVVCALYGPGSARPLLGSPEFIAQQGKHGSAPSDVITDLARSSFSRYRSDRLASDEDLAYETFSDQPADLRNSSIEHVKSIPAKLDVLGYEIVPNGSCYPEQKIAALSPSEIECLAILEHRRWLDERTAAGWTYGAKRDAKAKTSPYLVPWEDLPDRAREWNRSAVRNIPALLASENLAIARK